MPDQNSMNGFSDRGLSGRWLDPENDDIKKALSACLGSHRKDSGEIAEKNRQVIKDLLSAITNRDFTTCENLCNKELKNTTWIDSALKNKIMNWHTAERLLEDGEKGYTKVISFSRKYLDELIEQAKHEGINKTNLRQLCVTIMKGGLQIPEKENEDECDEDWKAFKNTWRKYDSIISLAEKGNVWAHDGLIEALQNKNELAAVRLVLDARRPRSLKLEKEKSSISFEIISEAYRDEIWNKLSHALYGVDSQEIYFMTIETMARAWENIWRYEHTGNLLSWLSGIAKKVKFDYLSKNNKYIEGDIDGIDPPDPNPTPDEEMEKQELINSMMRNLNKLPEVQRQAIELTQLHTREDNGKEQKGYHKDHIKYQEAAKILGVEESTIGKSIYNGKANLKKEMLKEGWTPEEIKNILASQNDERNISYAKKRILE